MEDKPASDISSSMASLKYRAAHFVAKAIPPSGSMSDDDFCVRNARSWRTALDQIFEVLLHPYMEDKIANPKLKAAQSVAKTITTFRKTKSNDSWIGHGVQRLPDLSILAAPFMDNKTLLQAYLRAWPA